VIPQDKAVAGPCLVQRLNIVTPPVRGARHVKAVHAAGGRAVRVDQTGTVRLVEERTGERLALPMRQCLYAPGYLVLGRRGELGKPLL
jgi:hypothetical protein